jgi:hypothetical protein
MVDRDVAFLPQPHRSCSKAHQSRTLQQGKLADADMVAVNGDRLQDIKP